MNSKRVIAIASILGIFLAGAVTGAIVSLKFAENRIEKVMALDNDVVSNAVNTKLSKRLKLSTEQQKQIAPMIDSSLYEARKIRQEAVNSLQLLVRSQLPTLQQVLDDTQQRTLEQWICERRPKGVIDLCVDSLSKPLLDK